MKLKWRTVTWYSQLLAILLFLSVFLFGFWTGTVYEGTNRDWQALGR